MTAQWQVSTNGGTSFADIPGASTVVSTGAATANADVSYNLPATAADDDGHRFRVVAHPDARRRLAGDDGAEQRGGCSPSWPRRC